MKKGFVLGLTIIGVLFVLVLLAPWLISLNQYKAMIQEKAFAATGREVVVNGDVRFGLLPSPYARLTDVVVKNPAGTVSMEFAKIKSIYVGVALVPLLSKKIQISHITISEPAINMETLADGSNNWGFRPVEKTAAAEDAAPSNSSSNEMSIDDLSIEKAYIRLIDDQKKTQQVIGPMEGKFTITSLQGPITGQGSVTVLEKLPIHFDATIASLPEETNGAIPFKLTLDVAGSAAHAALDGSLQKGDKMSARVDTAVAIPNLEKLLAATSKDNQASDLPAYLKGKTSFNGMVEWQDKKARIDNIMIQSGGMEITGSLNVDTTEKTSVVLDLARVAFPPEAAIAGNKAPAAKAGKEKNLAQNLAESFAKIASFLDTALPGTPLNLVVTAAQLPLPNQPVLRDVRLAVSNDATGVTIQNIEAKLPGNTQIKANGALPVRKDGKIDFAKITTQISSQDFQAALGNTVPNGDGAPINLQATTMITRETLHVQPLQVTQNGQTVMGDVLYNPKAADALVVAIKGSALNLDGFLGQKNTKKTSTTVAVDAKTPVAMQAATDPLAKLQGLKAKISAALDSVTYQGKTAKQIAIQTSLSDRGLTITQARIGDLGGMVIDAQGKIDRLSPLSGAAIMAQAKTPDLSATLKALGNNDAANLGASSFDVKLNGSADALTVALNGSIDQGKIAVNGTAKNLNAQPGFEGKIDVTHPETATILRNFAKMTPKINLGAFALQTNLSYGSDVLKANNLLVKLGSAGTLQGHVNVVNKAIDADLKADKLALAALMGDDTQTSAAAASAQAATLSPVAESWSKEPINLAALRGLNGKANLEIGELLYKKFVIRNLKTTASFADNAINLTQLRGGLFDAGQFNISGQLAPGAEGQAHRGDFSIAVDKTDAPKLFAALGSKPFNKGTLDLNQKITFNGASSFAIINSLNGDGSFKVTDGVVNGIDLDALAAKLDRPNSLSDFAAIIDQARAGGQTAISDLDMPINIRNGVVQVPNTPIKTQKTAMSLQGTVNLPTKMVDMSGQISFVEQRNLPALTLLVKGPMNDPQKSFDTHSFTSFYAQKATEKLQEKIGGKVQDKLNKLLGVKEPTAAPVATEAPAPNGVAAPIAPTAPTSPAAAPAAKKQDPLKQLGNQMLNNLLGGGK